MNRFPFRATGIVDVFQQVVANFVYFLSAELSGGATDESIIIKTDKGDELILKPGQGVPLGAAAREWRIYNASGVGTISGVLMLGAGSFVDNRPSGQTSVVGTVKTQETGLEYGSSYVRYGVALPVANTPVTIVTPAQNVNGVVIHQSMITHTDGGGGIAELVAKTIAPTGLGQGDALNLAGDGQPVNIIQSPIKVAAGKGIYLIANVAETGGTKAILYTVL